MNLSLAKCESIINTLPIGFYTGRRIDIKLDSTAETSYYDPMNDKIMVSYPIIAERLRQTAEGTCSEEEAIRSMLYHEVSHAILTPSADELTNNFKINVFEDERIETVLRNYFHGVNFRKQLYDIHGGRIPPANDNKSAYFNAVRFGLGTAVVQKEINRMLKKYAKMNRSSQRYGDDRLPACYEYDVEKLWNLISKEYANNPQEFQPQENGENRAKNMDRLCQGNGKSKEKSSSKKQNDNKGEEGQEIPSMQQFEGDSHECEIDEEQIKRMVGASLSKHNGLDEAKTEKLVEFQKAVEMIINNFNKKNHGGSGISAYSGVFNPRAVARKDYRFFERSMSIQGNNKFGTCHLNLIIDCSGSFCDNVPLTNGILAVLSEIERKNRNFSMDVAFINHDFHLCESVKERTMHACGGNDIPDNMKEILIKLQKPQTCNYNIILFDGDAICNRYSSDNCKLFSVFDMKQTTLITDPDNEVYMHPPFTSTKVVVTENYTEELIDHIIHALTIAFA